MGNSIASSMDSDKEYEKGCSCLTPQNAQSELYSFLVYDFETVAKEYEAQIKNLPLIPEEDNNSALSPDTIVRSVAYQSLVESFAVISYLGEISNQKQEYK